MDRTYSCYECKHYREYSGYPGPDGKGDCEKRGGDYSPAVEASRDQCLYGDQFFQATAEDRSRQIPLLHPNEEQMRRTLERAKRTVAQLTPWRDARR